MFLLQSPAPKTDAVTVGLGPGMKKPEADGSAPHRVSTTDAAQVTWWFHPPVALLPSGPAEPLSSRSCPQAAALGGQVAEQGSQGPLLTLVLLESPEHQSPPRAILCASLAPSAMLLGNAGTWDISIG